MSCIRIEAEEVPCEDIKPGELFSTLGAGYWGRLGRESHGAIGESVFVRTHAPVDPLDAGMTIFRITIERATRSPNRCLHPVVKDGRCEDCLEPAT